MNDATIDSPTRIATLDDLIGQEGAVRTIETSIESGRVHHAWLFSGPSGVGKRAAAEVFAGMLLDETTQRDLSGRLAPDPESAVQRMLARDGHPDLHVINKELAEFSSDASVRKSKQTQIAKAVLNEYFVERVGIAPTVMPGGLACKVFIIDEAELLDRVDEDPELGLVTKGDSQNAILKVLEEPPAGTVIVLVTSQEEALLPTIRSRCQRVRFRALTDQEMDAFLDRLDTVGEGDRAWAHAYAGGSPGRAAVAIETGITAWSSALEPMLMDAERGVYRAELATTMASLVDDWAKQWVGARANASKEVANRAGTRHLLSMLSERARTNLRDACAQGADPSRALATIEAIALCERRITANVMFKHALEGLAATMSA